MGLRRAIWPAHGYYLKVAFDVTENPTASLGQARLTMSVRFYHGWEREEKRERREWIDPPTAFWTNPALFDRLAASHQLTQIKKKLEKKDTCRSHERTKSQIVPRFFPGTFFTALYGMQTLSSDENSVCPSVRPSVRPSNACFVTKWKKDRSRFLYQTKDHLA